MVRKLKRVAAIVVMLGIVVAALWGCTKQKEPTNADIMKAAIQRAVSENCNIITPTIGVMEKAANNDGSWTFHLRYQCGGLGKSGKNQEMTLHLVAAQDDSGKTAWEAR